MCEISGNDLPAATSCHFFLLLLLNLAGSVWQRLLAQSLGRNAPDEADQQRNRFVQ
jgi:hypothetical protein